MLRIVLLLGFFFLSKDAFATYTLIVPQAPGGGTSVWAEIVARHLAPILGEEVTVRHIPGAKDIPGFNEFHRKLRFDPKVIMVSHGGNGISYLVDKVDYDYRDYEVVAFQSLDIVVARLKKLDINNDRIVAAGTSGSETDGMAMAMLVCGPKADLQSYLECFEKRFVWLNGVDGSERRLGFMRGEFNTHRESTAAWLKYRGDLSAATIWFTHGVFDFASGAQIDDPNFPGTLFEDVYHRTWGVAPKGELYDAYRLSRSWRDVIQKALWMNKGNPNLGTVRAAVAKMVDDPKARAALEAETGNYQWRIGSSGTDVVAMLRKRISDSSLRAIVEWDNRAYRFANVFKPSLLSDPPAP